MNILSALQSGYSPEKILNYISKVDPDLALKINTGLQAGHSIEKILNYLSQMGSKVSSLLGKGQKASSNIYQTAQSSIHPFLKGAAQGAGILGAGALGAYALNRALPQAAQALQGELLPALPEGPLQIGMQQVPQQITQQQKQLPFIQGQAQQITPPTPPIAPAQAEAPIMQKIAPLPEALQTQAAGLLKRNSIEKVEESLKVMQPKVVKEYEKATNTPIRAAIEEFAKSLSSKEKTQPMGNEIPGTTQPIETKVPEVIQSIEKEVPEEIQNFKVGDNVKFNLGIHKGKTGTISKLNEKTMEVKFPNGSVKSGPISSFEGVTKEEVNKPKIAMLPNGDIGEITNIRQGIATVNANGKEYRRKLDELKHAPEGLEEATRHLVNLIPEKEKSTAFQESIHITLPGMEGEEMPIMLTKYYGGKWAWYLGVSNDDYSKIALGTFEPKGEKRTGIAEYKPGVIDSRGAGNHELIIQNPKYSKANKGITWGYADTKYDMLKSIEETLKKMSKEELDEEGNIKQKREKQAGKGSASTGISKPQYQKEPERKEEKKLNKKIPKSQKKEISWFLPNGKKPIGYTTKASSDLVEALSNQGKTVKEIYESLKYDPEAKEVMKDYIDSGFENEKLKHLK